MIGLLAKLQNVAYAAVSLVCHGCSLKRSKNIQHWHSQKHISRHYLKLRIDARELNKKYQDFGTQPHDRCLVKETISGNMNVEQIRLIYALGCIMI